MRGGGLVICHISRRGGNYPQDSRGRGGNYPQDSSGGNYSQDSHSLKYQRSMTSGCNV